MKLSNRLSQKFKKLKEDFAGFPKSLSNEINKHKKLILTVALSGGVTLASFSQQDPNHPDNTYLSTEQLDVWTTNAAAQAEFDTPEERQNFIWREALVQYNALHGGHKDLAHYVPHQHSTEITTEITESGNLDTDASNYVNKVADGTMSSLAGALHILRPYGSNIRGTSVPNDLNDRRFIALNMDMATLRTKAHEFAHTFNGALYGGNHDNAMSNVFFTYTPLGGTSSTGSLPSIGVPTAGTQVEFYTSSEGNSIGNPAFWGDGTVSFDVLDASGVKIGDVSVNIADLDIDQTSGDPNAGVNDNVSDRIVEAINTGDPGYAPKINVVSAADEAPQPTFIVDDGKYKLTDGAEDDPLGFAFDAFGNKFPAKIKYYPYDATNDVNDANLDLPPGYGAKENGFTRAEVEAGIDKSFYDTNYPGVDIVWKRYSWDPDSLGASSEIITFTDTTPPVANTQPYTATLDANGNATLSFADIDNGSSDDSGTYSVVAFSPTSVDCSDTGSITASYTLEDPSGNQTSGTETVNVVDNTAPSLTTQNVAGFIDASGNYVANPTSFVQTATDACGIASSTLNKTNFSCSDLGVNTIQVTVTDNNGNQTTKPANLTLSDNINPEIPANLAVVGETSASISLNWSATSDNCSVSKYKIYRNGSYRATINAPTTSFTDTGLAPETTYNYTIISVDGSNNESASSGSVSGTTEVATDTEAPTAPTVTVSDVTDTSFNLTSQGSTDNVGVTATEFYLDENIDGMPNGTLVYTSTASQPVNYEFTDLDADTTYEAYARTTDFAGNASAFSNVEQVQTTIGIEERETKGLKVYPNPANEHLTISIDGQLDDIEIYNLQGQLIKEFDPQGASKTDINVNDLSKGMYLLHIWDKAGQRSVRKIVKN